MPLLFRDYRGELVESPKDFKIIAEHRNKEIVWSQKGKKYQVRYCLQVKTFHSYYRAGMEFLSCVKHCEDCYDFL